MGHSKQCRLRLDTAEHGVLSGCHKVTKLYSRTGARNREWPLDYHSDDYRLCFLRSPLWHFPLLKLDSSRISPGRLTDVARGPTLSTRCQGVRKVYLYLSSIFFQMRFRRKKQTAEVWLVYCTIIYRENANSERIKKAKDRYLGPVIQSIFSLTSSLAVKMLAVLISTISNSHVFLLKKKNKKKKQICG